MSDPITIVYTCHACGLQRVKVRVPAREPKEDVVHWLNEKAMPAVGRNHRKLSPACLAKAVDLAVPLPKEETHRVGDSAPEVGDLGPDFLKSKGAN